MSVTHVFFLLGALFFNQALQADTTPCRVLEENFRVDTIERLNSIQDVCEAKGGLGIFLDGVKEISLPRLRSARLINVESTGLEAVSFPELKNVSYLYVMGGQLKAVELPALQRVSSTMFIKVRHLQFLNLPNLGYVGRLVLEGNLELEFVFADSLYHVGSIQLNGNPVLNKGSEAILTGVTHVQSEEEKEYIRNAQAEIALVKKLLIEKKLNEAPMSPTGHPTYFGNMSSYYAWYPHYYYRYWNHITYWGYHRYYTPYWR